MRAKVRTFSGASVCKNHLYASKPYAWIPIYFVFLLVIFAVKLYKIITIYGER